MDIVMTEDNLLPVESEDTRGRCLLYCKQFLGDGWSRAGPEDVHMGRISGGLSNLLYLVGLTDRIPLSKGVPRKVLIRIYGQILYENPETVVTDSVVYGLLAEKRLGPRLWGVFTGGRVEEFIKGSRPLRCHELHRKPISRECARIMARFHSLRMPLVKEPRFLLDTMTRYLDEALNNVSFASGEKHNESQQSRLQTILSYGLANEYEALKHIMRQVDSPVVFCHNDLQEGNILYLDETAESHHVIRTQEHLPGTSRSEKIPNLVAIDFEYAAYNFRGFDIANHFAEWCYDYHNTEPPYFTANLEDYPTRDQQVLERQLLLEVSVFVLASHMLWALWSIVQAYMSEIHFDYMAYAQKRLEHYFKQKKELLESGELGNMADTES